MNDRSPVAFRRLALEDVQEIRPLWEELNQQHAAYSSPFAAEIAARSFADRWESLSSTAAKGQLRVEVAATTPDGPPVAYCIASLSPTGVGEIDSLYVTPASRRIGIASTLMQRALAWLNE